MITCKCTGRFKAKDSTRIVGYRIEDTHGESIKISPDNLKKAIKRKELRVINLSLTSDNRLIKRTPTMQEQTDFSLLQMQNKHLALEKQAITEAKEKIEREKIKQNLLAKPEEIEVLNILNKKSSNSTNSSMVANYLEDLYGLKIIKAHVTEENDIFGCGKIPFYINPGSKQNKIGILTNLGITQNGESIKSLGGEILSKYTINSGNKDGKTELDRVIQSKINTMYSSEVTLSFLLKFVAILKENSCEVNIIDLCNRLYELVKELNKTIVLCYGYEEDVDNTGDLVYETVFRYDTEIRIYDDNLSIHSYIEDQEIIQIKFKLYKGYKLKIIRLYDWKNQRETEEILGIDIDSNSKDSYKSGITKIEQFLDRIKQLETGK